MNDLFKTPIYNLKPPPVRSDLPSLTNPPLTKFVYLDISVLTDIHDREKYTTTQHISATVSVATELHTFH